MNTFSKLSLTLMVVLLPGLSLNHLLLTADPPTADSPPPSTTTEQQVPEGITSRPAEEADPTNALQDPLFQAIREELRAGRGSLLPVTEHPATTSAYATEELISQEKWKAVELILRAARILEGEAKPFNGDPSSRLASVEQTVARQLRACAVQIVHQDIER